MHERPLNRQLALGDKNTRRLEVDFLVVDLIKQGTGGFGAPGGDCPQCKRDLDESDRPLACGDTHAIGDDMNAARLD